MLVYMRTLSIIIWFLFCISMCVRLVVIIVCPHSALIMKFAQGCRNFIFPSFFLKFKKKVGYVLLNENRIWQLIKFSLVVSFQFQFFFVNLKKRIIKIGKKVMQVKSLESIQSEHFTVIVTVLQSMKMFNDTFDVHVVLKALERF